MADYKNLSLEQLLNHKSDSASWYWIGMAYMEKFDPANAELWLKNTMNDSGNKWQEKATRELAFLYAADGQKDKALQLFEKVQNYAIPKIHIGLLYYHGTETQHDPLKGKDFVEEGINELEQKDGMDYLTSYDLYQISTMYHGEEEYEKEKEYLLKTIEKCDEEDEDEMKEKVEIILRDLNKPKPQRQKKPIPAGATAESLIKRGFLFLEDLDWLSANDYFDYALDIDPEFAQAYVGLLCVELKAKSELELINQNRPFTEKQNFKKAIRFADEDYKITLEKYNTTIQERIEEKKRIAEAKQKKEEQEENEKDYTELIKEKI